MPFMDKELLTLAEAAKKFSRPVHINTVRRWVDKGAKVGGSRPRVKLRIKRVGWRMFTTPEWIAEFESACTGQVEPERFERPENEAAILLQLKARGVFGAEEKKKARKILGLPPGGNTLSTIPKRG
jgi:hypothetical protein